MSVIVGWQNDLVASAALLLDGTLVGAVEEERFTRVKQQEGFPARSISWLLDAHGLTLEDVDEWAYGWFEGANSAALLPELCRRVARQADDPEAVDVMVRRLESEDRTDREIRARGLREAAGYGVPRDRVTFLEHHVAHAWSAFACSPFETALVVTADGRGDRKSLTVSVGDENGLTEHEWLSSIDSLGHVYSQVTHALGFVTNRHEGKITGLAAYGDASRSIDLLRDMITWRDDRITALPGARFRPTDRDIPPETLRAMQALRPADLAAGVQTLVEELICRLIQTRSARYGQSRVALAGGLFANVALNRRVRELDAVSEVFVQPNMGDAGLALGAAAAAWSRLTGGARVTLPHVYLGPDARYELPPDPAPVDFPDPAAACVWAADQLARGAVLGLVRGACEFGPRALGHRSILADASDPRINDDLNARLGRTEFMPFAPVIRTEDAARSFVGWSPADRCAPFMTMAYRCTDEFAALHPATVHVDGTARPQVVHRETEPFLHELLTRYHAMTGRTAVVNTSFNAHEEPILLSAADAVRLLREGRVDALCTDVGGWPAPEHELRTRPRPVVTVGR